MERAVETKRIEAFFQSTPQPIRRKIFVVHGHGGMGKTQLCVEFARRQRDMFSAVLWLDGSSKDGLRQSLANTALRLPTPTAVSPLSLRANPDVQELIDSVLQWLALPDNTRWLLILDNVDRDWQTVPKDEQAYDFQDFLPSVDHGNVLVTTRLSRLQRPKASLHVHNVDSHLSREILETRAGKKFSGAYIIPIWIPIALPNLLMVLCRFREATRKAGRPSISTRAGRCVSS